METVEGGDLTELAVQKIRQGIGSWSLTMRIMTFTPVTSVVRMTTGWLNHISGTSVRTRKSSVNSVLGGSHSIRPKTSAQDMELLLEDDIRTRRCFL